MKYAHFFLAWIFVLVPGPVISYAGHTLASHTDDRLVSMVGAFLGTAEFWWWLVSLPWVFFIY